MKHYSLLFFLLITLVSYSQDVPKAPAPQNQNLEIETSDHEVHFAIIENAPIYSGCDENLSNRALKTCMSTKINAIISKNFNLKRAQSLGLKPGDVRINVQFKVNQKGEVTAIEAKGPHPELEQEAIRVIKRVPKFKRPGLQRGKAVTVPYFLPIKFSIEDRQPAPQTYSAKVDSYPVYRGCDKELEFLELKQCTTEKIIDFIKLSFDMELANSLFPQDKSTQFQVEFVIGKNGKPKNITAKAHKKEIASEAIKVVKRLPKFKIPGQLNGKAIDVPFKILMTLYFD